MVPGFTENETQLLDEWLKNDNRDRNLTLDSRDPDFNELWLYVRDDLLDRREDNFEDELNIGWMSKMKMSGSMLKNTFSYETMLANFLVYLHSVQVIHSNQKKTPQAQKRKLTWIKNLCIKVQM